MKNLLRLLPLLAASMLCVHAPAQTTQTWFTVSPESAYVTLMMPIGTVWRMSNPADGKVCNSSTYTNTPIPAYYLLLPAAIRANMPDCDPNQPKGVDVLEGPTSFPVNLTNKINPVTTFSTVTVPAAPKATTPPVTTPPVTTPPVTTPPVTTPPVTTPPVTTPPASTTPTVLSTVTLTLKCDILSNSTLNCTLPTNFIMPAVAQ